jgi:hypothetical protein
MLFHFATLFMLLGSASATAAIVVVETDNKRKSKDGGDINVVVRIPEAPALGPDRVQLGRAADFAVMSKSGIKASPPGTTIDGNIGSSPIAMTGNTGWAPVADDSSTYPPYTSTGPSKVTPDHKMYGPSPYMTSAIEDMMIAHKDAMGRTNPDFTNFVGYTYTPGLYLWTSNLVIPTYTNLTFTGGPDDVWIMKITTAFTLNSYSKILLADGARAENIFWAMGTAATIGTYAHTEGTFLAGSAITLAAYSSFEGAHMAQTAVTLDHVNGATAAVVVVETDNKKKSKDGGDILEAPRPPRSALCRVNLPSLSLSLRPLASRSSLRPSCVRTSLECSTPPIPSPFLHPTTTPLPRSPQILRIPSSPTMPSSHT